MITTATSAHAELIGRAARSGLPVFCEKPIALDLPGTLQAIAEVETAGTVLQMGFQRRFDAGYTGAREAVRSGRLGRLHTVRALTSDQAPPPAEWLPLSGGLYRDTLIHDFDILRWVTGHEIVDVYAAGSDAGPPMFRAAGDVDTAAALLTLDDGTLATATATRLNGAGYDVRMELAGELDQVVVGLDDRTPIASTEPTGPPAADKPWTGFLERFGPAYEAELAAFIEVVRGERANPCDGREALQALRIAEACEVSRREHRAGAARGDPGRRERGRVLTAPRRDAALAEPYQRTGRLRIPLISIPGSHSPGGPSSARAGARSRRVRIAVRASRRASGAPRQ